MKRQFVFVKPRDLITEINRYNIVRSGFASGCRKIVFGWEGVRVRVRVSVRVTVSICLGLVLCLRLMSIILETMYSIVYYLAHNITPCFTTEWRAFVSEVVTRPTKVSSVESGSIKCIYKFKSSTSR